MQRRGCTRIEVSVYAERDLCNRTGQRVVNDVLHTVSHHAIDGTLHEEQGLFVVQTPQRLWLNLAAELDWCCVLADHPNRTIYMAWYAHTQTKKIAGVRVK